MPAHTVTVCCITQQGGTFLYPVNQDLLGALPQEFGIDLPEAVRAWAKYRRDFIQPPTGIAFVRVPRIYDQDGRPVFAIPTMARKI